MIKNSFLNKMNVAENYMFHLKSTTEKFCFLLKNEEKEQEEKNERNL